MGPYFKAVNLDKREVICPWCVGSGAKLWEWAAHPLGSVWNILLRKSDEGGGGDYYGYHRGCGEGGPIQCAVNPIVGRWAGARVALVGDYDSSKLWDNLHEFRNISEELTVVWNEFIEIDDRKMQFRSDCGSGKH